MTVVPKDNAERLAFFRELGHQVHLGRCTEWPFGKCQRHDESGYFTPKDNDIASGILRWLEVKARS